MNTYDFKKDLTNSVFRLMSRLIKSSSLFLMLYFAILGLAVYALLPGDMMSFVEEAKDLFETEAQNPLIGSLFGEIWLEFLSANLARFIPMFLIMFFLGFIMYNFHFNLAKNEIENNDNSFGSATSNLLDNRILHYFIIALIIGIIYQGANFLVQSTGNMILSFLFGLIVGPVYYWFHLSYAKTGLEHTSFSDSMKFSIANMSFERVAKTLGISILLGICVAIIFGVGALISIGLVMIPYAGFVLVFILFVFLFGVTSAFLISGLSGLTYRYSNSLNTDTEELFVTD